MFDGINYLLTLAKANKLAEDNAFHVGVCTDLHAIEPMMEQYQTSANFIMVMDTVDGSMVGGRPSWFNRRVYTVAIVARHQWDDMTDRNAKLNLCREIYRQTLSRLIADRNDFENDDELPVFMRTESMAYREMDTYSMAGATGVVFTLRIDEPANLEYNAEEWSDGQ